MSLGSKNVWRTCALPAARRAERSWLPAAADRPGRGGRKARERIDRVWLPVVVHACRDGPSFVASGLQRRDAGVDLQVLLLQRRQGAVGLQRRDRLVDAGDQRVALAEDQAEMLAGTRELADHHRSLDLVRGDELSRRGVGDQRGDLVGLQRLLGVVEGLEDLRPGGRLDRAVDEGQACRPYLIAE